MNRLEKAAAFGAMMGKRALFSSKFTPDLKLQMALIAEREKLVDDWYNGDMEDYATHPDMGGNPEFDRRWNKAFNEKKEVEPRVIKGIPYPLYGSKPSWFPFRTQGMIDKAREEEYLRGDNEEAWDDNDFKTERALRDDHTREGVNNILNHYLDRNHGIVKNPYRHPADLEDLEGRHVDYKGMVQKSVPWKPSTDIDNINALFEETQIGDYKPTANRQKLFDQYYPYLDLAPSAKPSKKGPIAKAAAFGAMMGKRAANEDHDFKVGPPKNVYGGPHNRVGTLPSASTTPRVPDLSVKSPDGKWSLKSEEPYNAFISTNYSPPEGGLGTSRLKFHKSLTGQLNELNPKTSPTMPSRASLLGQDGAWNKWDARMGQIASDMSDNAPVPHMTWSKHPFEVLGQTPHAAEWSYTGSPRVQYSLVPRLHPDLRSLARYAGGAQRTTDEPRSLDNINATRVHENTHAGWQDLGMAGRNHYAHTTDYKGLPINNRSTIHDAFGDYYAKKAPGTYGNDFNSFSKGPRALRWYNTGNKSNKLFDNTYADPFSPSQLSDSLAAKGRTAAVEAGAVFNELGQSSRAFKDVTGKHMVGDYNFSPEVSMSNRELGELAKKYKPSDLNSPAGQLWLRRILETSK